MKKLSLSICIVMSLVVMMMVANVASFAATSPGSDVHISTGTMTDGDNSNKGGSTSYEVNDNKVTFNAENKEGYTFKGWYSDKALTNLVSTDANYVTDYEDGLVLYASFVKDGAAGNGGADSDTVVGTTVTSPQTGHDNTMFYVFAGIVLAVAAAGSGCLYASKKHC